MKFLSFKLLVVFTIFLSGANTYKQQEEVSLACMKRHNASNSCHYNFTVDGVNYRYIDFGCKTKRDEILKKVKEGKLGLAKDWKVVCTGANKPS
jgi:hypothetical protein